MPQGKSVLFVGLDPAFVDFSRWPLLTVEKLAASLQADQKRLNDMGHPTAVCFVDRGETAERVLKEALTQHRYDVVMIGAGIRNDAKHFLLFEKLVNVVHEHAPKARICFNTEPADSAEAVQRWL
jgi:Fe2+ transport system protein B